VPAWSRFNSSMMHGASSSSASTIRRRGNPKIACLLERSLDSVGKSLSSSPLRNIRACADQRGEVTWENPGCQRIGRQAACFSPARRLKLTEMTRSLPSRPGRGMHARGFPETRPLTQLASPSMQSADFLSQPRCSCCLADVFETPAPLRGFCECPCGARAQWENRMACSPPHRAR